MDGLELKHQDDLVVIRLNVQSPAGKVLAERYGFQVTPTFIFFDSQGTEIWRSAGSLDANRIDQWISDNT